MGKKEIWEKKKYGNPSFPLNYTFGQTKSEGDDDPNLNIIHQVTKNDGPWICFRNLN